MRRESFIFYTSWLEGVEDFADEQKAQVALALLEYCAYGKMPENPAALVKMAFNYAKPIIDANNQRYIASRKAGSQNGVSNNPYGRRGKPKEDKKVI